MFDAGMRGAGDGGSSLGNTLNNPFEWIALNDIPQGKFKLSTPNEQTRFREKYIANSCAFGTQNHPL